jgi:hypothetical protein
MSNVVTIEFKGDPDDLSGDVRKIDSQLESLRGEMERVSKSSVQAAQKSKFSWTELRSAYSTLVDVARVGKQVFDATFGRFQEYAANVRDLAIASGTGAQQASILLQTLDDFNITAADISMAAKAMKEKGIVPTVESLAQLSDQFLAIEDPAQRLQFAQDNLGKSYSKYLNVLFQGGDVLRKNAEQVNKNLILTDDEIRKFELERLAIDKVSDSWEGLKVKVGAYFGQIILNTSQHTQVIERLKEQGIQVYRGIEYTKVYKDELKKLEDEQIKVAKATNETADSTDGLTDSQGDAEKAAQRLSGIYTGLLSSMFSIQSSNDAAIKTMDDLVKKDEDLAVKKNQLIMKMTEEREAGKLTNEENLDYIRQLADITQAQEENAQAKENVGEDAKKAAQQRIYDLTQERLAADGIVDSGEFEYLQDIAVQRGLVSREAANQAISESKAADALIANFARTQPTMEQTLATMQQIAGYNGMAVNFGVNFRTNAPLPSTVTGALSGNNPQAQPGGYGYAASHKRDSGGAGIAGQSYMIGTGAQPEMFVPNTNGTFVPNAKTGTVYNIIVNNPKKETAENSIRRALIMASATGRFA